MGSMVIELLIIVLTKAKRDRFMQTIGTPRYCWFLWLVPVFLHNEGGGVASGGVKSLRLGGKVFWGNMTMGLPFFLDKSTFVYINIFRKKQAGVELLISRKLKPYTIPLSCHLHWQLSLVTSFTWTNFLIWYVSSPFWVFLSLPIETSQGEFSSTF